MANTYTQIYLHVVFAVSRRASVIAPGRREELQKYITGTPNAFGEGSEIDRHLLQARPHPYTAGSKTQYCSLRFDR